MRIHGEKVLRRRDNIEKRSNYHDYLPELKEDFKHICGYCGKSEEVTKNTFEIDHFIPIKYAREKENEYSNLVYSCYLCNRKKSAKWPSGNSQVQFIEGKGIVDPASDEYDNHLERLENGEIKGKTDVGVYMANEVFKFNERPIREVWQLMELNAKKKLLREKIKNADDSKIKGYIEIDECMDELTARIFDNKE